MKNVNNMERSAELEMALSLLFWKADDVPSPSVAGQPSYVHAQDHLLTQ